MSKKNNSPEQQAAWKANRNIGSRFIKTTPAHLYSPEPKEPSRRDRHRAEVASRQ
jgi:hypothetical protein